MMFMHAQWQSMSNISLTMSDQLQLLHSLWSRESQQVQNEFIHTRPSHCYVSPLIRLRHMVLYKCVLINWWLKWRGNRMKGFTLLLTFGGNKQTSWIRQQHIDKPQSTTIISCTAVSKESFSTTGQTMYDIAMIFPFLLVCSVTVNSVALTQRSARQYCIGQVN